MSLMIFFLPAQYRLKTMISHKNNFIFIHIPKCGGHTIEIFFKAWGNPDRFFLGDNKQHWKLKKILDVYPNCKQYFRFTFIRNPFSRLVSEYHYIKKCLGNDKFKLSFKDFCLDLDKNLNNYAYDFHNLTLCDYLNDYPIDFIGRLENFQEDFNLVCDKIGIQRKKLPHLNKTKHKHYTEYYDDETREIVTKKYAKDIEYFGYEFGE